MRSRATCKRVFARCSERGFEGVRPSFTPLSRGYGGSASALEHSACELAISAQACSQLANLLEAGGYLERRPNPDDRRSRVRAAHRARPRARRRIGAPPARVRRGVRGASSCAGAYRRFTTALAALYRGLGITAARRPRARRARGPVRRGAARDRRRGSSDS
jgi:hypothetical protein